LNENYRRYNFQAFAKNFLGKLPTVMSSSLTAGEKRGEDDM